MVAIIKANFNSFITDNLLLACTKELKKQKMKYQVFEVSGALEITFVTRKLIDSGKYEGIIALGCVIRGETYHFEIVSNESARAITELNLLGKIPVINGVLTCEDVKQADRRSKGKENKGIYFARALIDLIELKKSL